jgi:hypothetical protein
VHERGVGEEVNASAGSMDLLRSLTLTVDVCCVIRPEKSLDVLPRGLNGVRMGPGFRIDEVDAVVNGAMRVTPRSDIAVRTSAI